MANRRRRLYSAALVVAAIALLGLSVPAVSAETLHFKGGGTDIPGNQDQAKVDFKVHMENHKLRYAFDFLATKIGYPNTVPPIPAGHPDPNCHPRPFCGSDPNSYLFADAANKIDFSDDHHFFHKELIGPHNDPYEEWIVSGVVNPDGKHWDASGFFVRAASEAGLRFGGGSTGRVHWHARAD